MFKDLSVLKVICCETQTVEEKKDTKTKQHWNNLFEKERRRCCDLCSVWLTKRSLFPSFFGDWRRKKLPSPPPHFVAVGAWEGLGLGAVWRKMALLGAFSLGQ